MNTIDLDTSPLLLGGDRDSPPAGGGGEPRRYVGSGRGLQASRPDYFQSMLDLKRAAEEEEEEDDDAEAAAADDIAHSRRTIYSSVASSLLLQNRVEVRLVDYSYRVPVRVDAPSIKTVFNTSPCYVVTNLVTNLVEHVFGDRKLKDILGHYERKWILKDINLVLKPGKTYLVMGPPGCGKTSLLKVIAGRLKRQNEGTGGKGKHKHSGNSYGVGRIEYNGVSMEDSPDMVLQNIVSYVGQLDDHAPFLTVQETFDFAASCRIGTAKASKEATDSERTSHRLKLSENLTVDGLDLAVCRETYVGDADHRGVSGGQRRRVTVGEMMVGQNPVACADEISTGLDAAVTYDICSSIVKFAKAAGTTRLVSLLQPGPETFSLFDEVILLAEGQVAYAGPVDKVAAYFDALGYRQPDTMDVADFIQSVATPDGAAMFHGEGEHYTSQRFAEAFRNSERHGEILAEQAATPTCDWGKHAGLLADVAPMDEENPRRSYHRPHAAVPKELKRRYANPFWTSVSLNVRRNITLLGRDREFLIGKCVENFGMGIGMAMIFLQSAAFPSGINGSVEVAEYFDGGCVEGSFDAEVSKSYNKLLAGTYSSIFLTTFHILLGTLTSTPDEVDGRSIYYKHADARFYEAGAFLLGRQISQLPLLAMEIVAFGLPFYFIAGLAYEARAFFVYLGILIAYKFAIKMLYGVLAQTLPKKANVQGIGTFFYLILTLTSGFVVYPDTIPSYWKWLFWANPMAWANQGLATNQFLSSKYSGYSCEDEGGHTFVLGVSALDDSRGWQTDGGRAWVGKSLEGGDENFFGHGRSANDGQGQRQD